MANANKQLVREHRFWEIGNGEEANFFQDARQQFLKLQDEMVLPHLQAHRDREGIIKVKYFWEEIGEAMPFRRWNSVEWFERKSPGESM